MSPGGTTREVDRLDERWQQGRGRQPVGPQPSPSLDALAVDPNRAGTLPPDMIRVLLARCGVVQNALIACLTEISGHAVSGAEDRLLSVPVVAELLAVPVSYAYELARQGKLPTIRLGKYVRIRASALTAWLAGQDTGGLEGMAVDGGLGQTRTVTRAGAATARRQRQ
jgi:excisionase family DNA binding protein